MQKQIVRTLGLVVLLSVAIALHAVGWVSAVTSSSTNYSVNEVQFGAGSSLNDCSTSYCAKTSVGDTTVGSGSSANYSAKFGFNTSTEPMLEVTTSSGVRNMGVLTTSTTGTATSTINVRNYLSSGYIIQITGVGLKMGSHTMTALPSPSTSQQGTEQFGMNIVANTTPSVGADPVQVPSSAFSYGTAYTDYNTANLFKYTDGDIVAQSTSSSGETDYTLSMIANISNLTPGGQYSGTFSAVVVPTY